MPTANYYFKKNFSLIEFLQNTASCCFKPLLKPGGGDLHRQ